MEWWLTEGIVFRFES